MRIARPAPRGYHERVSTTPLRTALRALACPPLRALALLGCALAASACEEPAPLAGYDAGPDSGIGGVLALAGADLAVLEGSRVQLVGEGTRALAGTALLSWSQTAGPPVLLTNPSSSLPSFVAPLAPATLTFELRAEADGDTSVDRVTVVVGAEPGEVPAFVEIPGDAIAEPGSSHSFNVGVAGNPSGDVTVSASACRGARVVVEGMAVTIELPELLPCGVVVDALDEAGRGLAPASRVFWPTDTPLPAQTRLTAPLFVSAGDGASLSFDADPGTSAFAWSADGLRDVLGGVVEGDQVAFSAPRRRTRLAFAGERRRGGASGGVRVAFIEVRAGAGNVAPLASGGDDRIVQPSARFRIDTSGSLDLDGDELELRVAQVLGESAAPQADLPEVFQAPATPGTLLFHVVADDGVAESAPDSVRVVVSAEAENLRPIVPIAPRRFVAPGQTFTVDGRVAEDPDSGLLSSVTIRQLSEDPVIVLAEPAQLVATLVAGAAGDVYHFEITAFDDQGLGGAALHEVHVEEAGPYVDPVRGDDAAGNGTAEAPFLSIEGALPTAIDHALAELLLAEGEHAAVSTTLPAGLSLRGGLHFDGAAYLEGGGETVLPLVGDGLAVVGGKIAQLRARLDEASAHLSLAATSSIAECTVERSEPVAGSAIVVLPGASAVIENSDVHTAVGAGLDAAVVMVSPGAALRVRGSQVTSGSGDRATGLLCDRGTLAVEESTVSGGLNAEVALGIDARRCNVDMSDATLLGGSGTTVVGLSAVDSVIAVDEAAQVAAAVGPSGAATAVLLLGGSGSALLGGALQAALPTIPVTTPEGVRCVDGALALEDASITVDAANAVGIALVGAALSAQDSEITLAGGGVGLSLANAGDVQLTRATVVAGRAVDGAASFVTLVDTALTASEVGCATPTTFVVVDGGSIVVDGPASVGALSAAGAVVQDATLAARGASAEGVRLGALASLIERSRIEVEASDGVGVAHGGSLLFSSSLVTTRGVTAVRSAGSTLVRSATIVSDVEGLVIEGGGSLEISSTALFAAPGLRSLGAPPWLTASAVAFDDAGAFVTAGAEDVTTPERLLELGCEGCLVVAAALIDASGHLAAGANALVDAGDDEGSAPDDIDGEARPSGAGPDIGCDERP